MEQLSHWNASSGHCSTDESGERHANGSSFMHTIGQRSWATEKLFNFVDLGLAARLSGFHSTNLKDIHMKMWILSSAWFLHEWSVSARCLNRKT